MEPYMFLKKTDTVFYTLQMFNPAYVFGQTCPERNTIMKSDIHLFLCDDFGERFFGEGPYRLLLSTEKTGSLHAAALEMNMSYSKALKIITRAEAVLGYPLLKRLSGGKGGGGSRLTPEAIELLTRYGAYKAACHEANRRIFAEYFLPKQEND